MELKLRSKDAPVSLKTASGVGVIAIILALLPMQLFQQVTLAAPLPVWVVVVSLLGWWAVWALPVLAFLGVLYGLGRKPSFGTWVLVAAVFFAILTGLWLWISWDYGVKYQTLRYTQAVTVLNTLVFGVVIGLAAWGWARQSWWYQFAALVFLFCALVWCAFPYLGEAI